MGKALASQMKPGKNNEDVKRWFQDMSVFPIWKIGTTQYFYFLLNLIWHWSRLNSVE